MNTTKNINRIVAAERKRTAVSRRRYVLSAHARQQFMERFNVSDEADSHDVLDAAIRCSRVAKNWDHREHDPRRTVLINDVLKVVFVVAKKSEKEWIVVTMYSV